MERNNKRNAVATPKKQKGIFQSALIGGGIGVALIIMLALLSPFALLSFSSPNSTVLPMTAVCVFLGGISGATLAAKSCKDSPLSAGMLSAAVIAVPLIIVSLFFGGEWWLTAFGIIIASLAVSAFVGSWVVSKAGRSRKRNMKKALKRR